MLLADVFGSLIVLGILGGLYFLPTIVAANRNVPSMWSIAVINGFLGWTLVGWVVALAMAVRTVPLSAASTTQPLTRACPNCKGAMGRAESVCPHCGSASTPLVFHAGMWWTKGRSDEWQWLDEKSQMWRWYKDGTLSDPAAADKTPNLMIDPAVVSPPDAREPDTATTPSERPQTDSFAGELERLADLHARGALSNEQFETAKARLLGP